MKLRAYIYQCQDLPAADSNGTSDPFLRIWDLSENQKETNVCYDNNNPLYFEVIELNYEVRDINNKHCYPPFIIDVYDRDENFLKNSNDFLGRCMIRPEDASIRIQKEFENCTRHNKKQCDYCQDERTESEIPAVPKWHPIRYAEGEPTKGQVLISFTATRNDYIYEYDSQAVDLRTKVIRDMFEVNMLILGLRELQSPGILPVKKAFINFNLKSLVPPNSTAVQNIQTQPRALGPNPTINTTMKFQIPLPIDSLYCPKLTCACYDFIFKGLNQPMIGIFTVPIGDIMQQQK